MDHGESMLDHCETKEWNESLLRLAVCEVYASECSATMHADRVLDSMERLLRDEGHFAIAKECRGKAQDEADTKSKEKWGGRGTGKAKAVEDGPLGDGDAVALALGMATHPRLGADSPLARLDRELLAAIARHTRPRADAIFTTGLLRRVCRLALEEEAAGHAEEGRYFGEETVEFTPDEVAASNAVGRWRRAMEWACRAHPAEVRARAPAPVVARVGGWMCDVSERPAGWAGPGEWTNEALVYSGPLRCNTGAGWPVHDGGRTARPPLRD